ncbi:hypothetical protein ESCOCP368M_23360 [Escherichia coli]
MPTVITHAAVPLCIGLGLGSKVIPPRLLFAGIILAMLPDADVGNDSNLLIVFYVQIMPDDFVMQLHRF